MALPLQPDLAPAPPWLRRAAALAAITVVLALAALIAGPRLAPPRTIASGPGLEPAYGGEATRLIAGARERVWVAMFVVRPDDAGPVGGLLTALAEAATRGVDVRVLLDLDGQEVDKNAEAAAWLTAHGVRVITDEPTITSHAKVLIADQQALLGSHNWTRSALTRNREVSVVLADRESVSALDRWFQAVPGWAAPARSGPAP